MLRRACCSSVQLVPKGHNQGQGGGSPGPQSDHQHHHADVQERPDSPDGRGAGGTVEGVADSPSPPGGCQVVLLGSGVTGSISDQCVWRCWLSDEHAGLPP